MTERTAAQAATGTTESASTQNVAQGIAFLGGCGGNNALRVMRKLDAETYPHLRILIANTDGPHLRVIQQALATEAPLIKWKESARVTVLDLGEHLKGHGTGADPKVGKEAFEKKKPEVGKFLQGLDSLVIVFGAGGGTGGGSAPVLAEMAKAAEITTIAWLTKPAGQEGARRGKRAKEAEESVRQFAPTIAFSNESALNRFPDLDMDETWAKINEHMEFMLLVLREITQEVAILMNSDIADSTNTIKDAKYLYFGLAEVPDDGEFNLQAFLKDLLEDPDQDTGIIPKGRAAQIWLHESQQENGKRTWKNKEWRPLVDSVRKRMGCDGTNEVDDEIHVAVHRAADGKKFAAVLIAAKEAPDQASAAPRTAEPAAAEPSAAPQTGEAEKPSPYAETPANPRVYQLELTLHNGTVKKRYFVTQAVRDRWNELVKSGKATREDFEELLPFIPRDGEAVPEIPAMWRYRTRDRAAETGEPAAVGA